MSEFFLELFSEEIPAGLQKNLREKLLEQFQKFHRIYEKKMQKVFRDFPCFLDLSDNVQKFLQAIYK